MELSPQFVTDFLLNLTGYLIAGALAVIVYFLFSRKRTAAAPVESEPERDHFGRMNRPESHSNSKRKAEFIRLGKPRSLSTETASHQETEGARGAFKRGDRPDIIRIARRMLNEGASHEKIKKVLPISEAELALMALRKD